jgi:hypothetical protein
MHIEHLGRCQNIYLTHAAKTTPERPGKRLRISRFEREGRDLDAVAKKIATHFGISMGRIRFRCRGGKESEARKVFVHMDMDEYRAPSRLVAEYCNVGQAAVSALAKAGREIVQQGLDISIF